MADLTTQILIEIRDEIRTTNARLDRAEANLGARIDQTNSRLDRLERRQVETDVRLSTGIADLTGALHDFRGCFDELRDALLGEHALRETVADHERRLQALETTRT